VGEFAGVAVEAGVVVRVTVGGTGVAVATGASVSVAISGETARGIDGDADGVVKITATTVCVPVLSGVPAARKGGDLIARSVAPSRQRNITNRARSAAAIRTQRWFLFELPLPREAAAVLS
jgi:hypothetical protein